MIRYRKKSIIVLSALKKTPSQIVEILQIHPFRVKKISEHMHNFSIKKANNIIQELFWIDYNIKKDIIIIEISSDLYLIKLFL
ncbi:hypothetical protein [Spiroplasma endosymbiont of Polydrusus pterygomalis]|uniref:hypothetical protein n=1 Tax=Spiroplasma endosymbiont of Polydrusus pterygomalis TaxID=3139327 RepID=UPI003CCA71E4